MIYDKLFPFQKKIVDDLKSKQSYGLFLDMGLGKTITALALAEANNCTKIIVVTLKDKALETENTNGSWLYWSKEYDIPLDKYNVKTVKKIDYNTENGQIIVVNYQALFTARTEEYMHSKPKKIIKIKDTFMDFIKNSKADNIALIIDESHMIKNADSARSKCIKMLNDYCKIYAKKSYLYLLSGTPFSVGFIDMHNQLSLLGCTMSKTKFKDKFCIMGHVPSLKEWEQPIVGYKNEDEFYDLVHQYGLTIKSDEVVDLPEQIFINHTLPATIDFNMLVSEQVRGNIIESYLAKRNIEVEDISIYKTKSKVNNPFYRNLDYPDFNYLCQTAAGMYLRARQISIGFQGNAEDSIWYNKDRLNQLRNLLENNEDNYVLFYNYTPELFELYNLCEELEYNIDIMCGQIKSTFFYDRFVSQTKEERLTNKKNIILMNFDSGSAGGNYQLWNHCIIFSTPVYKNWAQSLKRVHRIGSKEPVFYHVFYQENWVERRMKESLEQGVEYTDEMFKMDLSKYKGD